VSVPILEPLDQAWLSGHMHRIAIQTALKEFVLQFGLIGGCVIWSAAGQEHPEQVGAWAEAVVPEALTLTAIAWQEYAFDPLFEIRLIDDRLPLRQLYGCLCHSQSGAIAYLLCWSRTALSEHQRYGMTLYGQTLSRQLPLQPRSELDQPQIYAVMQRARHQLRTPLALILLYADLLKTTSLDARSQEWLENLHLTAESMHISLEHLTEVPTPTAPLTDESFQKHDLRELLDQCCQELQPWITEKHLILNCHAPTLWLPVDGWKIKQVFQNLLSNAIAFSPVAGQITCEWQSFQTEVLIKLSDHGPGLSAEDLRSLGTPFYSRRPGGTGLGLSIAKQFVLEHRGSLWAKNLPEGGAQFCVMLPRHCFSATDRS